MQLLVVSSHGLRDGKAANSLVNGQSGCWFSWNFKTIKP